jgi:hypothetical protein
VLKESVLKSRHIEFFKAKLCDENMGSLRIEKASHPIFFLFEKPVHTAIRNCFEGAFIEEILFVKA